MDYCGHGARGRRDAGTKVERGLERSETRSEARAEEWSEAQRRRVLGRLPFTEEL